MKHLQLAAFTLFACTLFPTAYAETPLPKSDDKAQWLQLGQLFAECSAVYNLAATLKEAPDNGPAPYRELANSALVAGISATEHAGQTVAHLEAAYSAKYALWEKRLKKMGKSSVLSRADECLAESLTQQNQLVGTVRTPTAAK